MNVAPKLVWRYRTVKGYPVYALFLKDLAKNKTPLPNAFVARYKACAKLWRTTMVGKVKASHWSRASKIVYKRRIPLGRNFKGIYPYYDRAFAAFIRESSKGKKGTPDLKALAKKFAQQKKA